MILPEGLVISLSQTDLELCYLKVHLVCHLDSFTCFLYNVVIQAGHMLSLIEFLYSVLLFPFFYKSQFFSQEIESERENICMGKKKFSLGKLFSQIQTVDNLKNHLQKGTKICRMAS